MQRIGLLGGTFDPVHFGHLRPALDLVEALQLDVMRLLPCHRPSHREQPGASTEQRIAMLRCATEDVPQLVVDAREAERDKPSYSVDTLQSFREEYPQSQLLFFMGMDAFNHFTQWHRWQRILELAHLVVVPRPGASLSGESEQLLMSRQRGAGNDLDDLAGGILLQPVTQIEISATTLRDRVNKGQDIHYLTADCVRHYIVRNRLYINGETEHK